MKTLNDIINEGYEYPEIIPEDLQGVIFDWYQYRYVCDDEKFSVFFSRLLKRDYQRYFELLRIEPGVSQYDWLVSQYRELQRENTDNRTDINTVEGTIGVTESGNETQDITDTTTYNTTDSGTGSRTNTGGKTTTETIERDDTVTTERQDQTTGGGTSQTTTDQKNVNRQLPMSTSGITMDATGGIGLLDWSTGSAQTQTTGKENGQTTSSQTVDVDSTETLDSDETRTRTETNTGGYSDTSSKQKTGTETKVKDGSIDTQKTVNTEKTDESTRTTAGTGRTREIMTGRDNQIALMLDHAKDFIKGSNAWEWLSSQIDTVFMGVYDI